MHFATPWLLILLPLPWLIYYGLPRAKGQEQSALKIPFFGAVQKSLATSHGKSLPKLSSRRYLAYLIWLLLLGAAMQPQWLGKPLSLPRSGRDILLTIDLSGSMATKDMSLDGRNQTRLAIVKKVADQFISQRKGDRLGLVLFGTDAYLQTPLTFDRKTVQQMLNDASIGIAGSQTAIGDAIGLSIKQLMSVDKDSRVMILMTDGGNNSGVSSPIEAARIAAKEHIKIYTIGLGAKRMVVGGFFGKQVVNPSSDLDVTTLKKIATMTGGEFFRADDGSALQKIYQQINKLEPVKGDRVVLRPITPLYPYPLALAFIIALGMALSFLIRQYGRGRISS